MSAELESLKQALRAHANFKTLDGYYIEVNPALLASLLATLNVNTSDPDVPFFNKLASEWQLLYQGPLIAVADIKEWQAHHLITNEIIAYPACADLVTAELESIREISRHVTN